MIFVYSTTTSSSSSIPSPRICILLYSFWSNQFLLPSGNKRVGSDHFKKPIHVDRLDATSVGFLFRSFDMFSGWKFTIIPFLCFKNGHSMSSLLGMWAWNQRVVAVSFGSFILKHANLNFNPIRCYSFIIWTIRSGKSIDAITVSAACRILSNIWFRLFSVASIVRLSSILFCHSIFWNGLWFLVKSWWRCSLSSRFSWPNRRCRCTPGTPTGAKRSRTSANSVSSRFHPTINWCSTSACTPVKNPTAVRIATDVSNSSATSSSTLASIPVS